MVCVCQGCHNGVYWRSYAMSQLPELCHLILAIFNVGSRGCVNIVMVSKNGSEV